MPDTYTKSDKESQEVFILNNSSVQLAEWQDVIEYVKRRVESLNASIKVFEGYRDSGEPFNDAKARVRIETEQD